ncbi:MAG: A/G-specific adenine glycosylase [Candidatus Sumerlaeaceae bacterium]|nr:A/G-specific adenine glycosylase [Candidatus Sumerlaeaceae bacterium]
MSRHKRESPHIIGEIRKAREFSKQLVRWFQKHKRPMPWRETRDPYAILVSEVMLQQTTVAAVRGYYDRFLAQFPTIADLANAKEDEVLSAWAGLGYYRRARNLQAAACAVMQRHAGVFPADFEEILMLPGVGRYTAGAVASSAFGQSRPIVEANSARVLARLFAVKESLKGGAGLKALWQYSAELLPDRNARDHNYALMELGSLVCTPKNPACTECPVLTYCEAHRLDLVAQIPRVEPKPEKIARAFAGAIVRHAENVLIRRIPAGEWHAGLYEFPKVEIEPWASESKGQDDLKNHISQVAGPVSKLERLSDIRFTVTVHSVTLRVFDMKVSRRRSPAPGYFWLPVSEIEKLPLGSPQKKVLNLLKSPPEWFEVEP